MGKPISVLAVAASTGRVAYVYFEDHVPRRWGMSRKAAKGAPSAAKIVGSWVNDLSPDLLVSEHPHLANRKGLRVKTVLETIGDLFEQADGLNMRLSRIQPFQNKFEEAQVLARRFPMLKHLCPQQPPIWMPEPRSISYFEAVSFAEQLRVQQV